MICFGLHRLGILRSSSAQNDSLVKDYNLQNVQFSFQLYHTTKMGLLCKQNNKLLSHVFK